MKTTHASTLMLLGGSSAQLVAIEKANAIGYRTVLCDYLPDNPGQHIADAFYQVSTTDREAVLEIARKEAVDGIVAYGSDPAAPTAAYVAGKLGLPGIDFEIARSFCEKNRFRTFLQKHGFNVPRSAQVCNGDCAESLNLEGFEYPLITKPTDSSGSKGVTVVTDPSRLSNALVEAQRFSRNGVLIVEEFIQRDHPHVIEAEIFVVDGKVLSWGLINSIRDDESNPLLPAGYSYPLDLSEDRKQLVKDEIAKLVEACGKVSGAFNIEMIIDKNERLFFLDVGPRNGGNMLPTFISMISRKDIVEATLKTAMGETAGLDVALDGESGGFWGLGVLHSARGGSFVRVEYSALAKECLLREEVQIEAGSKVRAFERCNDLVGLSFFRFDTKKKMDEVMENMGASMRIVLNDD